MNGLPEDLGARILDLAEVLRGATEDELGHRAIPVSPDPPTAREIAVTLQLWDAATVNTRREIARILFRFLADATATVRIAHPETKRLLDIALGVVRARMLAETAAFTALCEAHAVIARREAEIGVLNRKLNHDPVSVPAPDRFTRPSVSECDPLGD